MKYFVDIQSIRNDISVNYGPKAHGPCPDYIVESLCDELEEAREEIKNLNYKLKGIVKEMHLMQEESATYHYASNFENKDIATMLIREQVEHSKCRQALGQTRFTALNDVLSKINPEDSCWLCEQDGMGVCQSCLERARMAGTIQAMMRAK